MNQIEDYATLHKKVNKEFIFPSYIKDVKEFVDDRYSSRIWGYRYERAAKLFTGMAAIAAFLSAGAPEFKGANLVSGVLGTVAMLLHQFSSFALNRSKENTEHLEKTIKAIMTSSPSLPDVIDESEVKDLKTQDTDDIKTVDHIV